MLGRGVGFLVHPGHTSVMMHGMGMGGVVESRINVLQPPPLALLPQFGQHQVLPTWPLLGYFQYNTRYPSPRMRSKFHVAMYRMSEILGERCMSFPSHFV